MPLHQSKICLNIGVFTVHFSQITGLSWHMYIPQGETLKMSLNQGDMTTLPWRDKHLDLQDSSFVTGAS